MRSSSEAVQTTWSGSNQQNTYGAIELPFFSLPLLLASCCCRRFVAAEDETSPSFRRAGQQQSAEGTKKQRKAAWSAKGSSPKRSRSEHREKPSLEVREDLGKFRPQQNLNMHQLIIQPATQTYTEKKSTSWTPA